MAQEVLIMTENTLNKLKKIILIKRFVNGYSREFSGENQQALEQFLLNLEEAHKDIIYGDIDIRSFESCENEEQEATALLELINRQLTGKGLATLPNQAISIANALYKFSSSLDRQALLVFHSFHDLYSEKEKNILRSLRKAKRSKISSYLGLLIVSNRKVSKWELFPESNLDERHVIFDKLENTGSG